ncbi:MAG: GyrI-like domain-containing protein [Pseudomonadota bacterium]
MQFEQKTLPAQHYLYVEKEVSMADGGAIAEAMGSAFGQVYGFTEENGIERLSMPISVYTEMPKDGMMRFRGAIQVSEDDAAKASGDIKADHLPEGKAMMTTHVGPYASLNVSHKALWDHIEGQGLPGGAPIWEIYVDDPTTVPEAECRTEIYRALG